MGTRLELQQIFESILGSRNAYYNPPATITMKYPCIRYSLNGLNTTHANNAKYSKMKRYDGIVICKESDPEIIDKILELPYTSLGTPYKADNLNHYPFTIYF